MNELRVRSCPIEQLIPYPQRSWNFVRTRRSCHRTGTGSGQLIDRLRRASAVARANRPHSRVRGNLRLPEKKPKEENTTSRIKCAGL